MMQEKKGMMKVWNMVLVSATFLLCIFGTTLTRTGLVASVHAFAQSPVKPYFTTFLLTATALTAIAIIRNLPYLQSEVEARERRLARIEFPVQQSDSAGELLCRALGHSVPGPDGSFDR